MKACQQQNYFTVLYLEKSLIHKINRMRGLIKVNLCLSAYRSSKGYGILDVVRKFLKIIQKIVR